MAVPPEPSATVTTAAAPPAPEPASDGAGAASRLGNAGAAAIALSFALTLTVALLGPSLVEPALPGPAQPPWSVPAHPSPYLTVALNGAAILTAVTGLILSLNAIRRGWRPPVRLILAGGILGAFALALVPPFGSSDHLSYAAYGRMAFTGHDPYTTTPAMLAKLGDPVARAVQDWRTSPSVYGPLAVAGQAVAAWAGGTSVRLIVFVLSLINVVAFAATGLLLHWLGRGNPARQLRTALMWTANPLLLLVLVAGAHVDSQAIFFAVAAVAVAATGLRGRRSGAREALVAAGAGALIGLGFAIKVTTALAGAGLAIGILIAARRESRPGDLDRPDHHRDRHPGQGGLRWPAPVAALGGLAAGFCVVAAAALIPWGTEMFVPAARAGSFTSIGSPWRVFRSGIRLLTGENAAEDLVRAGALLLGIALVSLLIRYLPGRSLPDRYSPGLDRDQLLVAGAFAVVFAWLLAWPYVLPWYDGLGWALLALLPASRFDWLMLARTAALAIGYLPARGIPLPAGLGWLETVVRTAVTPAALLTVVVLAVIWLWPARHPVAVTS